MRQPLQTTSYQSTPKPLGLQSLLLHDILSHNRSASTTIWTSTYSRRTTQGVRQLHFCTVPIYSYANSVIRSRVLSYLDYTCRISDTSKRIGWVMDRIEYFYCSFMFHFLFLSFLTYSVFDSFQLFGKKFIIKRLYFGSRKEEPSSPFGFRLVLKSERFYNLSSSIPLLFSYRSRRSSDLIVVRFVQSSFIFVSYRNSFP